MTKKLTKYGLWLVACSLWLLSSSAHSQDHTDEYPGEILKVFTDRTLYITGENILFSAALIKEDDGPGPETSRIIYLELIKPDGSRVKAGKYSVDHSISHGCLHIPEETITGYYYVKAYTRWMRNGSPDRYSFTRLKIVNPYSADLLTGENEQDDTLRVSEKQADQPSFRILKDRNSYHPGEEVELRIDGDSKHDVEKIICLTVVPVASWDSIPMRRDSISAQGDSISPQIQYFPETRGISISGRLLDKESGIPVPNSLVNLSIIGDKDVLAVRTNAKGQFFFALPGYTGSRDIFLCGEDLPGKKTELYIDNDFCSRPVNLPSPVFHLSETEKDVALKMAMNQKISSAFLMDTMSVKSYQANNELPFYGRPDEVLVMEKYIDLPTVEDYFSELLGSVNVIKYEGRKIFRFNSTRTEMTIFDPLVMIDWVAVNDMDKILAMSPKSIDRIELVNAPYIKGNITYGGIISFLSKNIDFAGIDLPTSGTFINYKLLEGCYPGISTGPASENIPDARNTVYWDPELQFNDEGKAEIRFTAPATPGKYIILLRGIGLEDSIICMERFVVAY